MTKEKQPHPTKPTYPLKSQRDQNGRQTWRSHCSAKSVVARPHCEADLKLPGGQW